MTFFVKSNSLCGKFHNTLSKMNSLILSIFSCKISFPKNMKKVPGKKDAETYSEPGQTSKMEDFVEIVNNF